MVEGKAPKAWQIDEARVDTETVQYWKNGLMITAQMSNQAARQAVRRGWAFVISGQAIGHLDANGRMAS